MKKLIAAAIALAVTGVVPVMASAAPSDVTVQAGQRITWGTGEHFCTLGGVGTDSAGDLVGLTAGHCNQEENAPVYLCANQGNGSLLGFNDTECGLGERIGTWGKHGVPSDDTSATDWTFIDLEVPARSGTVQGHRLDHAETNPQLGQVVYSEGQRTGVEYGIVSHVGPDGSLAATNLAWHGDSGGPVIINGGLAGITDGLALAYFHLGIDEVVPMSQIVSQSGGFTPLP